MAHQRAKFNTSPNSSATYNWHIICISTHRGTHSSRDVHVEYIHTLYLQLSSPGGCFGNVCAVLIQLTYSEKHLCNIYCDLLGWVVMHTLSLSFSSSLSINCTHDYCLMMWLIKQVQRKFKLLILTNLDMGICLVSNLLKMFCGNLSCTIHVHTLSKLVSRVWINQVGKELIRMWVDIVSTLWPQLWHTALVIKKIIRLTHGPERVFDWLRHVSNLFSNVTWLTCM